MRFRKRCEAEKEASVYFLYQATSKASSLGFATATPAISATDRLTNAEGVAEIATIAVANPHCDFAAHAAMEPLAEWWRLYFKDGSQREVREVPTQSRQGMLARYPDLERIESFDEDIVWVGGSQAPQTSIPVESTIGLASGYTVVPANNFMAASQFWLNGLQAEWLAIRHWLEQIGELKKEWERLVSKMENLYQDGPTSFLKRAREAVE